MKGRRYVEKKQDIDILYYLSAKFHRRDPGGRSRVGDRIHDIEAARENGCLSIGVLFGYGENEPRQADLTIRKFDDLLTIFDRRAAV